MPNADPGHDRLGRAAGPSASVSVERQGPVLVITLDRPHGRSAVDRATAEAVAEALDEAPTLAVGVLTGAGGTFSAGKDLKASVRGEPERLVGDRGFARLTPNVQQRPMIAAVEGPALGAGLEPFCGLIVTSGDAVFRSPEVRHGLVAREGGTLRLPRWLPYSIVMEMLLTGEPLPADRAAESGPVNHLTAPGAAGVAAIDLARRISANAPLVVRATMRIVRATAGLHDRAAFATQNERTAPVWTSADFGEGIRAFVERRRPAWTAG